MPLQKVTQILATCGTATPRMPHTALYNEGWMLRLTLDWFARTSSSAHSQALASTDHPLAFHQGSEWFSEARLPTQFRPQRRGDPLGETPTHADGAIGHFTIGGTGRAGLSLKPDAQQLVIVEAKMFSGLSQGTTRAPSFGQAARNVACLAEIIHQAGRPPVDYSHLGFVVLAPQAQIDAGLFTSLDKSYLNTVVQARVSAYGGTKDHWYQHWFVPTLKAMSVTTLSWEQVIASVAEGDAAAAADLTAFCTACYKFNSR